MTAFPLWLKVHSWSPMSRRLPQRLAHFLIAALAVLLVLLVKLEFGRVLGQETPFLLFFVTIIAATWYGSLGVGLFTLTLLALAGDYFFLPPFQSLALEWKSALQLLDFFSGGRAHDRAGQSV